MLCSGTLRRRAPLVLAVLCLAWATAGAVEVWTPQTGEVNLDEPVEDNVESRLQHAYALIGARQWAGAIPQLRKLLKESPEAEWAGEARLMLARALMQAEDYEAAFEELGRLTGGYPDGERALRAREMQYEAARRQAARDLSSAFRMYNQVAEQADDPTEAADVQRRKADAAFEHGNPVKAKNEYLALIDFYPDSKWVPYGWYQVARCEYRVATWLQLGMERLRRAERALRDFVELYPEHNLTPEAEEKLTEVRGTLAQTSARVARFYIRGENRPWAALNYLEHVMREFPEGSYREWAEEKIRQIKEDMDGPPRGETREVPLPGVAETSGRQ